MATYKKFFQAPAVVILLTVGFFATAQLLAAQTERTTAGYGYGTTCTATRPTNLKAKATASPRTIVKLSWKKVKFSDCDKTKASSYRVRIYKGDVFVRKYAHIKKTYKTVHKGVLPPNRQYKFKVRAVADDGALTNWSKFKKFVTPAA